MPSCERCWGLAYGRAMCDGSKMQSEHYQDLIKENDCTPEQQAGEYAETCKSCGKKCVHEIVHECMNKDCEAFGRDIRVTESGQRKG